MMPIEILMPALSPTMEDGTLAKWLVQEGDRVASGDVLAEIETDKATMEFEAAEDGTIGRLLVREGTPGVTVNTPIAVLLSDAETEDASVLAHEATADGGRAPACAETADDAGAGPLASAGSGDTRLPASPRARRLAAERGVDIGALTGSGPHGRVVKADVEAASRGDPDDRKPPAPEDAGRTSVRDDRSAHAGITALYDGRATMEVPLGAMRRTVAARLADAKRTVPHFYLRRTARIDALLELRAGMNASLGRRDVTLSVNDFIIKACADALQQVPAANAVWAGDRILRLMPSDVAVAVAVEGGLYTPVIRDAETKSLSALSEEIRDLAARARDHRLEAWEYEGGSFAVSNLGMLGVESFDAIVNPPHGAILAVGAGVRNAVVAEDGSLIAASQMALTLSVDHRVIDGALGAELLGAIVHRLENPLAMLA